VNFSATASCLTNEMEIDVVVSGRPDGKADEDYYFAQFTKEYFEEGRKEFNKYIELTKKGDGNNEIIHHRRWKRYSFLLERGHR